MIDANEMGTDFLFAEYREAANAYFKGVDIGFTGIKIIITINAAVFGALIAALAEPKLATISGTNDIVNLIPVFALIVFIAVLAIMPHYFRHLENCRHRCQEIEELNGGLLFTRLGQIGNARDTIGSLFGATMVFGSIGFVWIILSIKLKSFTYIINILN